MGLIRVVITRIVEDVAAALALVAAGVLLLAQGGRFSDRLDIITHFSPLFLVLAILAALLGAMTPATRLRRFTLATSAAGLVLAGLLVLPEMLRDIRPFADPVPAGDELKIIQINSWSGRNETLEDTADWLVSQDPDIIVAQESNRRFQSALEARGVFHRTCDPDDNCEVVIYSKVAPVSRGLPRVSEGAYFPATRATFEALGRRFTVIGAHYTWPIPAGPQQQQSLRLARIAELYDKERLIIAGDFNATPWSFSLRRQDRVLGLTRRNRAMLTWPAKAFSRGNVHMPLPFLAIDHVYAGDGWRTVRVERGPSLGSDHFPVIVTLAPSPAD